jgi:hypothetical protein
MLELAIQTRDFAALGLTVPANKCPMPECITCNASRIADVVCFTCRVIALCQSCAAIVRKCPYCRASYPAEVRDATVHWCAEMQL